MLKSLDIQGFRCFRQLRVEPLTQVNLFVGQNNAGKTSLLEAAELVAIGGVEGLMRSSVRRSEQILVRSEVEEEYKEHVFDPSHLFFGHDLQLGSSFKIQGHGETESWVECAVEHASVQETLIHTLGFRSHVTAQKKEHARLTISPWGGVLPPPRWWPEPSPRVNFLEAESIDVSNLGQLWGDLVLTTEEEEIIRSLRIIEPLFERLAFIGESRGALANIIVRLTGNEKRLPLGNLGGGLRHLLALVLNLLSAQGGFLLVDEIDTGLHYSVMLDMWRLLVESAKRLRIQVFATTHSLDCVRALGRLRRRYPEIGEAVTLHRVERDASTTVVYDADEIVVAAEGHIEVR